MATSDAKPVDRIPDTYIIPAWLQSFCSTETSNIKGELEFEESKAAKDADSTKLDTDHVESSAPLTTSSSAISSGRSSVVIVDADHQVEPQTQNDHETAIDQSDSQTTIKADSELVTCDAHLPTASSTSPTSHNKIKKSIYTAIKDTFAPALISNHQLLAFGQPTTIALAVKKSTELPLADAVVLQLAEDFDARTILLDAEDIEDLAWEFDAQQRGFDKINRDKKTAEKAKKQAEREKQRLEREEKKAKRTARKAEKEKKAAEAAKAEPTGAKSDADKDEKVSEAGAETESKSASGSSTDTVSSGTSSAETTEIKSKTAATQTTNLSQIEESNQVKDSNTTSVTTGEAQSPSDPITNEKSPTAEVKSSEAGTTPGAAAVDVIDSGDALKAAVEAKTEEKTDAKGDDEKKVDDKKDGEKKDDSTTADEKKEDDSDAEEPDEPETPEETSDSDNEEFDTNIDTYWNPCQPSNPDSGYDMTRTYFATRGNMSRSKQIYKHSKNALLSFLRGPDAEAKPAETKSVENKPAEDESKSSGSLGQDFKTVDDKAESQDGKIESLVQGDTDQQKPLNSEKELATLTTGATDTTELAQPEQATISTADAPAITDTDNVVGQKALTHSMDTAEASAEEPGKETDLKPAETETILPQPLIICIRDVNTIMENENGADVLARFGDLITVCRESNQRAVLVVTLADGHSPFKDDVCPCGYPYCCNTPKRQEKMFKRLKIDASAKIDLSLPTTKAKVDAKEEKTEETEDGDKVKREYTNVRRLKRYLRHGVPAAMAKSWFNASEEWQHEEASDRLVKIADKKWNDTRVRRAARQIIGRGVVKEVFQFEDVLQVINHLDDETENDKEDEKEKSEAAKAFDKKLEKVKEDCNSHEERLLESIVKPSALDASYDDVIIDNDTKDAVKQLITLFKFKATSKSKKLLKLLNITGAMFYGPPGTGKTHLCRAMANDYGACMLALEASTLMDMWVGETEKLIKAAFTLATKLHPCILFVDEADSLFRRRTTSDKSWERNALTMYLQQMDGIGTDNKRPFVIVATNRPSDLDDAFLRRLPHKVLFSLPSEPHRAAILKLFLEEGDIDSSVDFNDLAKQTRGLSGSDLKSLCGQAVLAWATEKAITETSTDQGLTAELKLTSEHFKTALKRTRPTVSRQALADVDSFARQYDSARF